MGKCKFHGMNSFKNCTPCSQRRLPSSYLSSWLGTALHMSLAPLIGLVRFATLENWNMPQLKTTWNGLEAFWDLGCCLIFLCLRIQIQFVSTRRKGSGKLVSVAPSTVTESAMDTQEGCSYNENETAKNQPRRKGINSNNKVVIMNY